MRRGVKRHLHSFEDPPDSAAPLPPVGGLDRSPEIQPIKPPWWDALCTWFYADFVFLISSYFICMLAVTSLAVIVALLLCYFDYISLYSIWLEECEAGERKNSIFSFWVTVSLIINWKTIKWNIQGIYPLWWIKKNFFLMNCSWNILNMVV